MKATRDLGRRSWAWLVLLLPACTIGRLAPADPDDASRPAEPIVVVSAFNETGGMKWLDLPALVGVLLAADQLEQAAAVMSRRLEVVRVDGITDPTNMARRLTGVLRDREDEVAVVGITEGVLALPPRRGALRRATGGFSSYDHSSQLLAVAPVVDEAGVPLLSVGSTDPKLSEGTSHGVFSVAGPTDRKAAAIADFARQELGVRSIWLLLDRGYDYTRTAAAHFRDRWIEGEGSVVGEVSYESGTGDLSGYLDDLLRLDPLPEAVFLGALPGDGGPMLRQIREAGFDGPVLAADWFDTPYVQAYAGELADGLYYSTDVCLCDPHDRVRRFVDQYRERNGEPPRHGMAALGYDAIRLLADALERAGSKEPADLSGALADTSGFASLGGPLSFEGDRRGAIRPVIIVEVDDGEHRLAGRWEG